MILDIKDLKKSYGKHEVLKGLHLKIGEVGLYALIGPNGSGKTTLFSLIANLLKKNAGEIKVLGTDNGSYKIFEEMTFLKDNSIFYNYLTGMDHLNFLKNIRKLKQRTVDNAIELLKIGDYVNKRVGEYSLGMKQSLLLAMNVACDPKFMILDEPFNGLDPTAVIRTRKILNALLERGTTVLFSSHTLSTVDLVTSNIFFLKDGKVIEDDFKNFKEFEYVFEINGGIGELDKSKFDFNFKNGILSYKTDKEDISVFIKYLYDKGVSFKNVDRKEVGAEERYVEMYSKKADD